MKKIIGIFLIVLLIFGMGISVMAEETSTDTPTPPVEDTQTPPQTPETPETPQEKKVLKVSLSKTNFFRDEEVQIKLTVDENPSLKNFMFEIDYDKSNLEYTGFSLENSAFTGVTVKEQPLQVSGVTTSNIEATGLIMTLKFKAKEGAPSGTEFKVDINKTASYTYNASDEKTDFEVTNGYARIICRTHNYGQPDHLPPTCTEDGYTKSVCTECGYVDNIVHKAAGHNVPLWQETAVATCIATGHKQGVCSVCNQTVDEELPLIDHEFGDWTITLQPTLDNLGETKRICFFCGFEEIQNVAKLVTGITDATSGAMVFGNDGVTFYGDAAFSAKQSLFYNLSAADQTKVKNLVSSLVGKKIHSRYSVNFANADGTKVTFDGTVTVTLPIDASIKGVVVVGNTSGSIAVLNASVDDGLAVFTLGAMPDEFYILCDEEESGIVGTIQNMFADEMGEVSTAGKIAGWVIIILIALILLGLSVAMIVIGIRQQRRREKIVEVTETQQSFEVEQTKTPQPSPESDEEYDETVRQMVNDWFNGPKN